MFSTILLVVAAGATIAGGVRLYKRNEDRAAEGFKWVEESVEAWRSNELDRDNFSVHVKDTQLDDLFTTFDHDDGDPYYSPEGIENRLVNVTRSNVPTRIADSTEAAVTRALDLLRTGAVRVVDGVKRVGHRAVNKTTQTLAKPRK
ncbi:hypothetical protein [Trueperella bialowiezensis]|uniref:Uncharacterized protein n=1 Tax=Trueperella bialowiezensis TaxID=312285 RepID=A0A448PCM0_9ACTO|nr:hypothetical protein [Trueperella bialowiezensis]VEI12701.1 Uncharacterised protein [Trueperella bialowiezensis]